MSNLILQVGSDSPVSYKPPYQVIVGKEDDNYSYVGVDVDGNLQTRNLIWNPSTLAWEKATGSLGSGSAVEVTNFPESYPVSGTIAVSEDNKAMVLYDDGAGILYLCKAPIGTSLSAASWQIQKINTTISTQAVGITWADGDSNYNNTATNLATVQGHSYS